MRPSQPVKQVQRLIDVQTRPFSARGTRSQAANGAVPQVIAPAAHATAGSRPPDMQDGSNSKYPQVVQPQNSVEACVFDDGGADSVLDGASVEFGGNRNGTVPLLHKIAYIYCHSTCICLFVLALKDLWGPKGLSLLLGVVTRPELWAATATTAHKQQQTLLNMAAALFVLTFCCVQRTGRPRQSHFKMSLGTRF